MNHRKLQIFSAFVLPGILNVITMPVGADTICHNFTGSVTSGAAFGLTPTIGDEVHGSIIYDTDLPPTFNTGSLAGYNQSPPNGMSVTISGSTFQNIGNASFQMSNNFFGSDAIDGSFLSISVNGEPTNGGSMFFRLNDSTSTVFSSTALPADLPVDDFESLFNSRTGRVTQDLDSINFSLNTIAPCSNPVKIDIKPGGYPNSIALNSNGVIPVAILTTGPTDNYSTFNAAEVDPSSVKFGPNEAYSVSDALEDVDQDGDIDMILHFDTQETGILCQDISSKLSGETLDGQKIAGTDSLTVIGCN